MSDKTLTVGEIVAEYLRANGYGGLCMEDCGCTLDDLVQCGEIGIDCQAGIEVTGAEAKKRGYDYLDYSDDDRVVISEFPKEATR